MCVYLYKKRVGYYEGEMVIKKANRRKERVRWGRGRGGEIIQKPLI